MDDNKLYRFIWGCITAIAIAVSIVVGITTYNVHQDQIGANSPNPALYQCSLSLSSQGTQFCVNLAQQH